MIVITSGSPYRSMAMASTVNKNPTNTKGAVKLMNHLHDKHSAEIVKLQDQIGTLDTKINSLPTLENLSTLLDDKFKNMSGLDDVIRSRVAEVVTEAQDVQTLVESHLNELQGHTNQELNALQSKVTAFEATSQASTQLVQQVQTIDTETKSMSQSLTNINTQVSSLSTELKTSVADLKATINAKIQQAEEKFNTKITTMESNEINRVNGLVTQRINSMNSENNDKVNRLNDRISELDAKFADASTGNAQRPFVPAHGGSDRSTGSRNEPQLIASTYKAPQVKLPELKPLDEDILVSQANFRSFKTLFLGAMKSGVQTTNYWITQLVNHTTDPVHNLLFSRCTPFLMNEQEANDQDIQQIFSYLESIYFQQDDLATAIMNAFHSIQPKSDETGVAFIQRICGAYTGMLSLTLLTDRRPTPRQFIDEALSKLPHA